MIRVNMFIILSVIFQLSLLTLCVCVRVCVCFQGKETTEEEDEVAVGMEKGFMDEFFEQVCCARSRFLLLFRLPFTPLRLSNFTVQVICVTAIFPGKHSFSQSQYKCVAFPVFCHQSHVISPLGGRFDMINWRSCRCGTDRYIFYFVSNGQHWSNHTTALSLSSSEPQHWCYHFIFLAVPPPGLYRYCKHRAGVSMHLECVSLFMLCTWAGNTKWT